jgi:hypothetical protein
MNKLPVYPADQMNVLLRILEEVIRYTRLTNTGTSKSQFLYLYSQDEKGLGQTAKEGDLQSSMLSFFLMSEIAYGFEEEKDNVADGGRVDIVFKSDLMTIPIELKKSLIPPTVEADRRMVFSSMPNICWCY